LQDLRDKAYKLIEINARTWLWVELAKRCGVNFALILYNYLQKGICPAVVNYPIGVKWMHYVMDIPNSIAGMLKRRYSIRQIASSYAQGPAPAVFSIKDPLPFLAELFLLPLLILKR
jgi:predicted ATP-grasp superfamily ATP-dependent carboligase